MPVALRSPAALLTLALCACTSPAPAEPLTLVRDGVSSYAVVIEPDASPSERHAAEELIGYLEEATGAALPLSEGAPVDGRPMIVLGQGEVARGLGADPDPAALGDQGYLFQVAPPHVVIAGTPEVGTLHGVHRFLEEVVGVRWLAPEQTRVPQQRDLMLPLPMAPRVVRPAFAWRNTSYAWPGADADFRARVGDNDGTDGADSPTGIQEHHDGHAHSYFWYVSPEEFFDTHPEYFSEIGGVRVRDETQLCLTNPDVLEIVTERMLARMAADPTAKQHNFSQHDTYNYCTCKKCRAMNELYGTAGGTQFWFVNQLAERTAQVFPDKLIGTLAYMYTEEPPVGMQMHPNVAVWLCHMFPSCDSHPIESCPLNADYKRRAEAWATLTDHLFVWHYVVDFMHYYNPFPNFRAMAADMRFYQRIGVEGVYLQGMGHGGGGGEWSLLRPYYGMKLLWDPQQDPDALIDEFLADSYGAAAPSLRSYIDLLHDEVTDDDVHMHLYTNPAQGYLPDEIVAESEALFDTAEAAVADDALLLDRVQVARMPLVYARLFPRNGYTLEDGELVWQGDIATLDEIFYFLQRMEAHGFTTVREVSGEADTMFLIGALLNADWPIETITNGLLQVDVVPVLAGRALRITDLATDECVTAYDVRDNLYFPFAGGLEDRVGDTYRYFGWVEQATVTYNSGTSVAIALDTMDGWRLTRTLTLLPDRPVLQVESAITNPSEAPRATRLRSHLELDLGSLASVRMAFVDRGGQSVDRDLTAVIAGLREGEQFFAGRRPHDAWTFTGDKGLAVTQRFDGDEVESSWIYAYPASRQELEVELWSYAGTLAPGETLTLRQQLEVRPAP